MIRASELGMRETNIKKKSAPATPIPVPVKPLKIQKVAKDFFGRVVSPPKQDSENQKKPVNVNLGVKKHAIVYKFNEGFSNAVRKPVYVKDFM